MMTNDVADQEWTAHLRALTPDERSLLLDGAAKLLQHPDALCPALESELYILTEHIQPPAPPTP